MDFPGKCHFDPCSFCTGLCGFCITVRIPPTMLQNFIKTSLWFCPMWPLRTTGPDVFSKSCSSKIKGIWLSSGEAGLGASVWDSFEPLARSVLEFVTRTGQIMMSTPTVLSGQSTLIWFPTEEFTRPECLKWILQVVVGRKCLWAM